MKKLLKKQKGITLIALVITIVVLLILASVAINITVGENGIFNRATQAKEQYEMAAVKEKLNLAILEVQTGEAIGENSISLDDMLTSLQEKLPGIELEKDGETLKGTLDGYDFVIDSDFKVTIEGYNEEAGNGGSQEPELATYTVTFNGENVTSSGASSVEENASYTTTLTPAEDYKITGVTVKMRDTTLTQGTHYTYENGIITIASVTGNLTITVTTEKQGTTISNPSTSNTKRTGNELPFTWEELSEIAHSISNQAKDIVGEDAPSVITEDTSELTITKDGTNYTIGVGDYRTITYNNTPYTVRILGFNHDDLTNENAYGEGCRNTKAGISFEFDDILDKAKMNTTSDNTAGWGSMLLRNNLNDTYLNKIGTEKTYIKQVKKIYLKGNGSTTTATSNDSLWLLACSEIWGHNASAAGLEGTRYKYYSTIVDSYSSSDGDLIKKYNSTPAVWWFRSPLEGTNEAFCCVSTSGSCSNGGASNSFGVVPGFAI